MKVGWGAGLECRCARHLPSAWNPRQDAVASASPGKLVAVTNGERLGRVELFKGFHVADDVFDRAGVAGPADVGKGLRASRVDRFAERVADVPGESLPGTLVHRNLQRVEVGDGAV